MGHFHHKMDEIQISNNGCFSMGHYHPYLESDYTWLTQQTIVAFEGKQPKSMDWTIIFDKGNHVSIHACAYLGWQLGNHTVGTFWNKILLEVHQIQLYPLQ